MYPSTPIQFAIQYFFKAPKPKPPSAFTYCDYVSRCELYADRFTDLYVPTVVLPLIFYEGSGVTLNQKCCLIRPLLTHVEKPWQTHTHTQSLLSVAIDRYLGSNYKTQMHYNFKNPAVSCLHRPAVPLFSRMHDFVI